MSAVQCTKYFSSFSAYIDHRYEREEQILSVLKTDPDEYKSTLTIVRTVYHILFIYIFSLYKS